MNAVDTKAACDAWKLLVEGFESVKRTMTHDMYQGTFKKWMLDIEEFINEHGAAPTEIKSKPLRLENVIVSGVMKEAELDGDEDASNVTTIVGYEIEHYSNITLQKLLFSYLERYNGICPEIIASLPDFEVGTNIAVRIGNCVKGYLVVEELRYDK